MSFNPRSTSHQIATTAGSRYRALGVASAISAFAGASAFSKRISLGWPVDRRVLKSSPDHLLAQLVCPFANAWAGSKMVLMPSVCVGLLADVLVIMRHALIRKSLETHTPLPLTFNPSSTRRRMASARVGSSDCLPTHSSSAVSGSGCIRISIKTGQGKVRTLSSGSCPSRLALLKLIMLAKVCHYCIRLGLQTFNFSVPIAMNYRMPSQRGA